MEGEGKSKPVYFGELGCQARYETGANKGKTCHKKAYYRVGKRYVCGVHSAGSRMKLPKNPNIAREKLEKGAEQEASVKAAQKQNKERNEPGKVKCAKMRMMLAAPCTPGYLNVYPNFKHQNRKDGFGCASLSPMSLGPVRHGQKGLPPAGCLENYHQFNKVYENEIDRNGKPTETFRKMRLQGYESKTPIRHKYTATPAKRKAGASTKGAATKYSLHSDSNGVEKQYTYVQSRYFYCHFYEELVRGNKDLEELRCKIKDGVNIQITGYDGFDVNAPLIEYFKNTSRPFGHELVLYTILTVEDPRQYPWNEYYMANKELYPKELAPSCFASTGSKESEKLQDSQESKDSTAEENSTSVEESSTSGEEGGTE